MHKWFLGLVALFLVSLAVGEGERPISPLLLGQNHWLADGDEGRTGYLHALWDQVEASGVQSIRIGGNGYQQEFPDRRELDRMVAAVRAVGAEPILQVPSTFTARQAMELVEHYTRGERRVAWWSIGNEPFLHKKFSLAEVHDYIVRIGTAMKTVDPDLKLFIYDAAWLQREEFAALLGGEFDVTGRKVGDRWLVDGVSFHRYPQGETFTRDDVVFGGPRSIEADVMHLRELLRGADARHGRTGEAALRWGLTEFNVTYANPDRDISRWGNPSFLGGQFVAEVFGLGMKHGATMMNQWCINETDAIRTDFGYIGLPGEFYPRSSYYHMQLMSRGMGSIYVSSSSNRKYVKTVATRDGDRLAVMLLNQSPVASFDYVVRWGGSTGDVEEAAELVVTLEAPGGGSWGGRIPAQTTQLLVFDTAGGWQEGWEYGLTDNLQQSPPRPLEGSAGGD